MSRPGWIAILRTLASAVVCAAATAQTGAAIGNAEGSYRIAGVLVNAATGAPVQRGLVQALDKNQHLVASSTTDADGRFVLDHLGASKYQLLASKRGFRTASYDEHDEFATSIVTGPDQDTTHLTYKLIPNAVLHGTVTSDDGEPVANANVMLFKRPGHRGARIERAGGAQTDDTGEYEVGDLNAGEYLLAVTGEPWYALHGTARRNSALDVVYPVTFFDSTTEERAATPIELTGGMRQEINISMHAVPALHISLPAPERADGSVVMPQLQRVAFGNVIDSASSGDFFGTAGGRTLEMSGVAPGHYELMEGEPPHVVDVDLSANQQIDADAGISAHAVRGQVRMTSGLAVPDDITLTVDRTDGGAGQTQFVTPVRRGQFSFIPVPPGEYAVSATSGDKAVPVVAVGAGATQAQGNVIALREGGPPLLVTLCKAETRVEGFAAKSDKGFAGAMMVLLPKNPVLWKVLTRRDQSDSDGSFAFRDVAPGEYTAIAIEDGWPLDWTDPAVMERYLRQGTSVRVSAGDGKLVRLAGQITVQQR